MEHKQAIDMISAPELSNSEPQIWADFGCGSGAFTLALAHHLKPKIQIIAIDKDSSSLKEIPNQFNNIPIEKKCKNFTELYFLSNSLNGVLMANSLHYV